MADFPENIPQQEEEFSTIFSDPTEHRRVEAKAKKVWPKILASILAVAILISGTVAVIKLIPVLQEETVSIENITVKDMESDDISTVVVTNGIGTTEFYSVATKENEKLTTVDWYIKSLDKALTRSMEISDVVDALTSISASREITEKNAKDCGLEEPPIKAVVTPKEGESYTVLLGNRSPDNSGYYCKLQNEDKIYMVSNEMWDTLNFELLDFANTDTIPGFTNTDGKLNEYFANDQLAKFDRVTLKGDKHPKTVVIEMNEDERISQYLGYMVTSPTTRIAQNTEALLMAYQGGIDVVGAYSYDVKPETLKALGLDTPDLEITMYVKDKSLTYKFAAQSDGYYAAIYDDSKLVHKVDGSSLTGIIDLSTTDYYSTWVCYNMIDDLSDFVIKTNDKEYSFNIVKNDDDSSSEESSEEEEAYTITYNGKKLVAMNFQTLYQYCVSLKCNDYTVEKLSGEPEITLIFKYKEGGENVIAFTKASATKYQYSVDGKDMGRVAINDVKKVVTNAQKVANGETISEIA